jgi:outer membrane biogenesis lipoprotein LolB
MKTLNPRLAKIFAPALLLAACMVLSSCIIVAPRHPRHERHDHRRWEAPRSFSQEVRP